MKTSLKKRLVALLMTCIVFASASLGVASATSKSSVQCSLDKWKYNTSIIHGTYNSSYKCLYHKHYTGVCNNKNGHYNSSSAAALGWAEASVDANWFGPDGTAYIWH